MTGSRSSVTPADRWQAIPCLGERLGPSKPNAVYWVDPGKMSGWACWYPNWDSFESGQLPDDEIGDYLSPRVSWNWLGWEAWRLRPGSSRITKDTTACEVIGVLKYVTRHSHARVLIPQEPSARELGLTWLAGVGWHNPSAPHGNDAAAHLLSWMFKNGIAPSHIYDVTRAVLRNMLSTEDE